MCWLRILNSKIQICPQICFTIKNYWTKLQFFSFWQKPKSKLRLVAMLKKFHLRMNQTTLFLCNSGLRPYFVWFKVLDVWQIFYHKRQSLVSYVANASSGFWITLPKNHFTEIFWPKHLLTEHRLTEHRLTESHLTERSFDRIAV
jgi:hypothetical protein